METTSDVPLVLVAVEAEGFVSNRIAAVLQNQATGLNMSNDTPPLHHHTHLASEAVQVKGLVESFQSLD